MQFNVGLDLLGRGVDSLGLFVCPHRGAELLGVNVYGVCMDLTVTYQDIRHEFPDLGSNLFDFCLLSTA